MAECFRAPGHETDEDSPVVLLMSAEEARFLRCVFGEMYGRSPTGADQRIWDALCEVFPYVPADHAKLLGSIYIKEREF